MTKRDAANVVSVLSVIIGGAHLLMVGVVLAGGIRWVLPIAAVVAVGLIVYFGALQRLGTVNLQVGIGLLMFMTAYIRLRYLSASFQFDYYLLVVLALLAVAVVRAVRIFRST